MSTEVKRYSTSTIILHWGLAVGIFAALGFGMFVLDDMPNTAPGKHAFLKMHLEIGSLILLFTLVRLVMRMRTPRPAPFSSGNPAADKLGVGVQHLLVVLTIFTTLAGMAMAASADLFTILYRHIGSLPEDFDNIAAHKVHGLLAYALLAAIALHVLGALKNQFILKNNILARMSLRKKS